MITQRGLLSHTAPPPVIVTQGVEALREFAMRPSSAVIASPPDGGRGNPVHNGMGVPAVAGRDSSP